MFVGRPFLGAFCASSASLAAWSLAGGLALELVEQPIEVRAVEDQVAALRDGHQVRPPRSSKVRRFTPT
jgi:hypothetical protein